MLLASREGTPPGQVQAQAQYLGKDMVLIHMLAATAEEAKLVAASGASMSASPESESRIGYGLTKACDFMDAVVRSQAGVVQFTRRVEQSVLRFALSPSS